MQTQSSPFEFLTVSGLSVRAGGRQIAEPVSFSVSAGEIVCLFGGNGSGKTTLFRTVLGLAPDYGAVKLAEQPGVCLQFPEHLIYHVTVRAEAVSLAGGQAEGVLARLGLAGAGDMPPQFLSEGQKRALFVYGALACRKFVMLDEPFASLDAEMSAELAEYFNAHAEAGGAVFYTANRMAHTACAHHVVRLEKVRGR